MNTNKVGYGNYLQLEKILGAQAPVSASVGRPAHDEMLFIITHQTYELWFKQILIELDSVIAFFSADRVGEHEVATSVRRVGRANKIMELVIQQFPVIETMTALDFLEFRDLLHPASGFQSGQFRVLETRLGLTDSRRINKSFRESLEDAEREAVARAEQLPNMFDAVQKWLENMPFLEYSGYQFWKEYRAAVKESFDEDRRHLTETTFNDEERSARLGGIAMLEHSFDALFDEEQYAVLEEAGERRLSRRATLAALFIFIYREFPLLQLPFQFLDGLVALDHNISAWRYRHALMTSRMIGGRIGTGGSSGFSYLAQSAVKHRVFGDILSVAGLLISRQRIPELPLELKRELEFYFTLKQ